MTAARAQSEVVASALLVGIVVLAVGTVGYAVVGDVGGEERTLADVAASADADAVTLTHRGGEPIRHADLRVLVSVDGSEPTAAGAAVGRDGDGDDRFEAGERRRYDPAVALTPGSTVRVLVADDATGTVVADERIEPTG